MQSRSTYRWLRKKIVEVDFGVRRIVPGEQLQKLRRSLVLGRKQLRRGENVLEELDGEVLQSQIARFEVVAMLGDPVTQDAEHPHGGRRGHDALLAVQVARWRRIVAARRGRGLHRSAEAAPCIARRQTDVRLRSGAAGAAGRPAQRSAAEPDARGDRVVARVARAGGGHGERGGCR